MVASPLPSRGPKRMQNCYVAPAFSGVPNTKRGEKIRMGCITSAFSGAQKRAELLRNPCNLGGSQLQARGENQKWLPHPTCSGAQSGRNCCVTPAFSGVSKGGFNKCPHRTGQKKPLMGVLKGCPWQKNWVPKGHPNQKWPTSHPTGYITTTIRESPMLESGGQNQKWPTSGPIGYITPAVWVPNASGRGTKSEVANQF